MDCREARPLLTLFLDGELDARQMRGVAMHSTRCVPCEKEVHELESLQDLVHDYVSAEADAIDLGRVWTGVAARLGESPLPLGQRIRQWLRIEPAGIPLYATAAAVAALAVVLWSPGHEPRVSGPMVAQAVDNSVTLEWIESDADSVALMSEPETNTTVLWITDPPAATAGDADFGGME